MNPTLGEQPWEPYFGAPRRARFGTIPWGCNPGNPTLAPLPGQGLEPYQSRGL